MVGGLKTKIIFGYKTICRQLLPLYPPLCEPQRIQTPFRILCVVAALSHHKHALCPVCGFKFHFHHKQLTDRDISGVSGQKRLPENSNCIPKCGNFVEGGERESEIFNMKNCDTLLTNQNQIEKAME